MIKSKMNKYVILIISVVCIIMYLIINQFKMYQYYNDLAVQNYKNEIEEAEVALQSVAEISKHFLENTYIKIEDKKADKLEKNEDGTFSTNNILEYVPETFTGNYFGLVSHEKDLNINRRFQLLSYLDDALYKIYIEYYKNWENYLNKANVSTLNVVMTDLYIYKFPYKRFSEGINPYEQQKEQYGDIFLKKIQEGNSIELEGLHKNEENNYVFTAAYPVEYFDENIGYVSIDFYNVAFGVHSNNKLQTFAFTDEGEFLMSDSEALVKADSTKEIELFLNSNIVKRCRNLMQHEKRTIYFGGDKIFFFNRLPEYNLVIVNVIPSINLLIAILPIIIMLILSLKTITNFIKYKKVSEQVKQTINELEIKNEKLEKTLKEDFLTNILTKTAINDSLQKAISNYNTLSPFCVCICDIDNIKKINRDYSYYVGDMALKHVTKIIKQNIRGDDEIAMWNGPQILIILRDIEGEEAYKRINNIKSSIEKTPLIIGEESLNLTSSFGIACYKKDLLKNKLLINAEKSLQIAKNEGKNMTVLYKDK